MSVVNSTDHENVETEKIIMADYSRSLIGLVLVCLLFVGCLRLSAHTIAVRLDRNDSGEAARLNLAFLELARERNMYCIIPNEASSFYINFPRDVWKISTCTDFALGSGTVIFGESDEAMFWEVFVKSDRGVPDSFGELCEKIEDRITPIVGSQRVKIYPRGASAAEINAMSKE